MQNLKYLEKIDDNDDTFGVVLNEIARKKTEHIQFKIALSLLEFFNSGKFVDEKDIEKRGNAFYVSKKEYFKSDKTHKSKVFSLRINILESQEETQKKIKNLNQKIEDYKNL